MHMLYSLWPLIAVACGIVAALVYARFRPSDLGAWVAGLVTAAVVETVGRVLLAVAVVALSGCASAWVTAGALVDAADAGLGGYTRYTHAERARLLAVSGCKTDETCIAALQPFDRAQLPVLACFEAVEPLVNGASEAVKAKNAAACTAAIPELAVKVPLCVAAAKAVQK